MTFEDISCLEERIENVVALLEGVQVNSKPWKFRDDREKRLKWPLETFSTERALFWAVSSEYSPVLEWEGLDKPYVGFLHGQRSKPILPGPKSRVSCHRGLTCLVKQLG